MPQDELDQAAATTIPRRRSPIAKMSDEQLAIMLRNRETLALLTWEPWMHNPKLKHRCTGPNAGAVRTRRERRPGVGRLPAGLCDAAAESAHADYSGRRPCAASGTAAGASLSRLSISLTGWSHESLALQRNGLSVSAAGRHYPSIRVSLPNRNLRSGKGRCALRPLHRRMADRRGRGRRDHAQRASSDRDLRRSRRRR